MGDSLSINPGQESPKSQPEPATGEFVEATRPKTLSSNYRPSYEVTSWPEERVLSS